MCALQPATRNWLEESLQLDPNVVDAMLANGTRPRILIREEGVMINLRGINLRDPDQPEDMISLRIWIDDHNIVTCRRRDLVAIEDIMILFQKGNGPATAGDFLTELTCRIFSRMAPYIDDLERCVQRLEESYEDGLDDDFIDDAGLIRRRGSIYRRHIVPQMGMLHELVNGEFKWLTDLNREDLAESYDQITRYSEVLNAIRERTQILNEELRIQQADRLNRITYLFSVVATIFLPLSFFTGLMGINIAGMPGTENGISFWLFVAICIALAGAQIALFRKKKWF
jgi:zinc transporter